MNKIEIIKQNDREIVIRLPNGDVLTIQENGSDSVIISAMPPKVIETRLITGIYIVVGACDAEQVCKKEQK